MPLACSLPTAGLIPRATDHQLAQSFTLPAPSSCCCADRTGTFATGPAPPPVDRAPGFASERSNQIVARYSSRAGLRWPCRAAMRSACPAPPRCLEPPRGKEIVGVVDSCCVQRDDPLDAVLVLVGVGHDRVRCKDDSCRSQDSMVGHEPCGRPRYFLISARDMASDSPELSKPASLAGSTGNSFVGRMSMPVRSRIV